MILDQDIFLALCALIIVGTCASWLVVQIARLRANLAADGKDRDAIFGNLVGIVMMLIGLVGVAKHYWE